MTSKDALFQLTISAIVSKTCHPTRCNSAQEFVARGLEIPDWALPGRLLQREMKADSRIASAVQNLTSQDSADVAPWVVRIWSAA